MTLYIAIFTLPTIDAYFILKSCVVTVSAGACDQKAHRHEVIIVTWNRSEIAFRDVHYCLATWNRLGLHHAQAYIGRHR